MGKQMRKMLKETERFKVFIDTDKLGNPWKKLRSKNYNYSMNLRTGLFYRWAESEDDDPEWSPFGPEILDFEITDICHGIKGKLCNYCYKSNTPDGKNTSFETFRKVISEINYNSQLTQVAFGLGASGIENPDLWDMCKFLRKQNIIPNGTVADVTDKTAAEIGMHFGACSVSYHGDYEVLADTIMKLGLARVMPGATLAQINIHFMLSEETYEDCLKLFEFVQTDYRFKENFNAIVLLGLKQCGRAETGYSKISDRKFRDLVRIAFEKKIGIGFDSCTANRFAKAAEILSQEKIQQIEEGLIDDFEVGPQIPRPEVILEKMKLKQLLQLVEPCESGLFSSYVNVKGEYHHCSFMEQTGKFRGLNLIDPDALTKFEDYWPHSRDMHVWRDELKKSNRSCPVYDV